MDRISPPLRAQVREAVAGRAPWPLVLLGPPGTGKTCAALCLLDHSSGEYLTATGLAEAVAQAQQGRLEWRGAPGYGGTLWPEQVWDRLGRRALIVLDELGSREKVSDHHYECVKRVLDLRHGHPLVVASNLSLDALAGIYDDRITSRLAAGTVVYLDGPDRRLDGAAP